MALSRSSTGATVRRGLTDGDVYVLCLQTVVLAHRLMQPPPDAARAPRAERVQSLRGASTSARATARLPDRFLRHLKERLERVAMGRDPEFRDAAFRQVVGVYYGTLVDDVARRRKDQRTLEELVLGFCATAQAAMRKRCASDAEARRASDGVMDLFDALVGACLRSVPAMPKDVMTRWHEYSGMKAAAAASSAAPAEVPGAHSAAASPLVAALGPLFGMDSDTLRRDVQFVGDAYPPGAAAQDMRRALERCAAADDAAAFLEPSAYDAWRAQETAQLRQLYELAHAPATAAAPSSTDASSVFALPPPDAPAAYQRLLSRCVDVDLEAIRRKAADEEVSLAILSPVHAELLHTCAEWWRVSPAMMAIATLRLFVTKYDAGDIPLECLDEALYALEQWDAEAGPPTLWRAADRHALAKALRALSDSLLRAVYGHVQEDAGGPPLAPSLQLLERARRLASRARAPDEPDPLQSGLDEVRQHAAAAARRTYAAQAQRLCPPGARLVPALQALAAWADGFVGERRARFADGPALADAIEAEVWATYARDLYAAKDAALQQVRAANELATVNDVLELWSYVAPRLLPRAASDAALRAWFRPYVEQWLLLSEQRAATWIRAAIDADTFEPVDVGGGAMHSSSLHDLSDTLQQPIQMLGALQWPSATEHAQFVAMYARSIARLLEQYAVLLERAYMATMTSASQSARPAAIPATAPLPTTTLGSVAHSYLASLPPKHTAWLAKARQTIRGSVPHDPPLVLQPRACVMLNDIEAAKRVLDALREQLHADETAALLRGADAPAAAPRKPLPTPPGAADAPGASPLVGPVAPGTSPLVGSAAAPGASPPSRLFALKIVQAELLAPRADAARLDTFVMLSDDQGARLAKTRTIFDTPSPRWDEVVELSVRAPMWISATVWQRLPQPRAPELLGRASLCLDEAAFARLATQEVWLDLERGSGQLLLKVSLEEAQDGLLYQFARTARLLKRVEVEMVRVLVDHMALFMRRYLSREVLHTLVRGGRVDRALDNVRALYATALAQAQVGSDAAPRKSALSDVEMEAAILPLLDYLEDTLGTLHATLSEAVRQFVLTRVWKEVLWALEALLVPPLSDAPCAMRPLPAKEADVVFKWLSFLRSYFNAYDPDTGQAHGIPLDILQGPKYRELLLYPLLHDQSTDELMIECVRGFQARLAAPRRTRAPDDDRALMTDMAMKILRMRPGTGDFLAQQLASIHTLQATTRRRTTRAASSRRVSMRLDALLRS